MELIGQTNTIRDYQRHILDNPPGMAARPERPHIDANPDCQKCGGYGWAQSRQYGTWFICRCTLEQAEQRKKAQEQAARLEAAERCGLHSSELSLTWAAVKPNISDGIEAVNAVKPAYYQGHGMILLWGTWGQAKTLTGKIMIATAFREGKSCAYAHMNATLDNIKLAFDAENQNTELLRRVNWWVERDVLFLDELDKASTTEWAEQRIFELLDRRYTRAIRQEALTVIASNESSDQLNGYLHSRLDDSRLGPIVYLNGPDGRKVMQKEWKY